MNVIYAQESYRINGAAMEVYNILHRGMEEAIYQEALEMELASRGIPFKAQAEIEIKYKGKLLKQTYRADVLCYDKIILELKAVKALLPEHEAQLQNYLRATGMKVGLLVNFCHYPGVAISRIVI